ncbi:MAG: DUF423 domain-containing protein [Epsilonproteobacteria bacterium]|nr:MAG: DUF423 domain-containing protein [Campylobacterota bacterium]RLA65372.1 MAG: DUF423 domain-containing protein [Campylobacterota bacterium]
MEKKAYQFIFWGSIFLFLAVGLGAFGAHGLEKMLTAKLLATYKTGVTYQFYHGFALLLIGILQLQLKIDLSKIAYFFLAGIILFSFNCYLYSMTQIKILAMIIPFGGVSFLLGWGTLVLKVKK